MMGIPTIRKYSTGRLKYSMLVLGWGSYRPSRIFSPGVQVGTRMELVSVGNLGVNVAVSVASHPSAPGGLQDAAGAETVIVDVVVVVPATLQETVVFSHWDLQSDGYTHCVVMVSSEGAVNVAFTAVVRPAVVRPAVVRPAVVRPAVVRPAVPCWTVERDAKVRA
ncbi:hypothetical protein CPLU01_12643 [Colletotrichum plurivorum]|uniref:Uncharacterized protein n=1 Tax=Colletotrichum plurivorum TaxID=2175906 RepID=A0A8H6JY96_9PEZI|nr:hypothetical protein CPLU01_12643 [Colletotrichum plurivorum]